MHDKKQGIYFFVYKKGGKDRENIQILVFVNKHLKGYNKLINL